MIYFDRSTYSEINSTTEVDTSELDILHLVLFSKTGDSITPLGGDKKILLIAAYTSRTLLLCK